MSGRSSNSFATAANGRSARQGTARLTPEPGIAAARTGRVAILAGGGTLPPMVAAAAHARGRRPVVFAIAGECDPLAFGSPVHVMRWGEIGRLFHLMAETGCSEAVFIGSIARRPDFRALRPDLGTVRLLPRILKLMAGGDDRLLSGVAAIFESRGVRLVGPLAVAPELAIPSGDIALRPNAESLADLAKAAEAARLIGRLDIGQAAVAVKGRVVATEDAGGTDDLLRRVAELRERGRIAKRGGVLVKCMKPQQDPRLDLPTIGPATAEAALRAGLDGVAAEAGRALLAGRAETVTAFCAAGVFLLGIPAAESP